MIFGMNTRTILLVGIALVAAAATALFARGWLNAQKAALDRNQKPALEVLVAAEDIPTGHFIKANDLRWQPWPEGVLAPSYVIKGKRSPQAFDGAVVRTGIAAGQPITDVLVVRPGEQGFLAAVLDPAMRAVSIKVDAISGISGFVFPGDRVDLVLTHTVPGSDGKKNHHVSETVLEDVRVLAVDQRTDDQNGKVSVANTVTFEVTPRQAEKVALIKRMGMVSLSLRPVAREPRPAEQAARDGNAAAGATPAESAGIRPESVGRGETGRESAALSPIGQARASEAPLENAPVSLVRSDGAVGTALAPRSVGQGDDSGRSARPAGAKARARPHRELVPRHERAGVTRDSDVSRVIRWGHSGSTRPSLQIVRGSKVEERKF